MSEKNEPYKVVYNEESEIPQKYTLSGPGFSMNYLSVSMADIDCEHLNLAYAQGVASKNAFPLPDSPERDEAPKTLKDFEKRLMNDPVAYAYYNMGRAVERDKNQTDEQRARKDFDAIYSQICHGFEHKILPDVWTAEFEAADNRRPSGQSGEGGEAMTQEQPREENFQKCGGPINETQPILFPGLMQCEDGDCAESFRMPKCRCVDKDSAVHESQCPLYEVYSIRPKFTKAQDGDKFWVRLIDLLNENTEKHGVRDITQYLYLTIMGIATDALKTYRSPKPLSGQWKPDDNVVKDDWVYAMECPECNYLWDEDCILLFRDLKLEVQSALQSAKEAEERWEKLKEFTATQAAKMTREQVCSENAFWRGQAEEVV